MPNEFKILDRGDIHFFYRPKVEHDTVKELRDVQRFSMVLKSRDHSNFCVVALGKKRVPSQNSERVEFAFVEHVASSPEKLKEILEEQTYDTLTRGERHLPAARLLAEGKYLLTKHANAACLDYQLKPDQIGDGQRQFALAPRAQYLIFVKNPDSDPNKGLPPEERAKYSAKLRSHFRDYKFIPLPDPEFLAIPGAELLLIDDREQNPELDNEDCKKALENFPHTAIEQELRLDQTAISDAPLREGKLS